MTLNQCIQNHCVSYLSIIAVFSLQNYFQTNATEAIHLALRINPAYATVDCVPETMHDPSVYRESLPRPFPELISHRCNRKSQFTC